MLTALAPLPFPSLPTELFKQWKAEAQEQGWLAP